MFAELANILPAPYAIHLIISPLLQSTEKVIEPCVFSPEDVEDFILNMASPPLFT